MPVAVGTFSGGTGMEWRCRLGTAVYSGIRMQKGGGGLQNMTIKVIMACKQIIMIKSTIIR